MMTDYPSMLAARPHLSPYVLCAPMVAICQSLDGKFLLRCWLWLVWQGQDQAPDLLCNQAMSLNKS